MKLKMAYFAFVQSAQDKSLEHQAFLSVIFLLY
jgi:hypothetical protein